MKRINRIHLFMAIVLGLTPRSIALADDPKPVVRAVSSTVCGVIAQAPTPEVLHEDAPLARVNRALKEQVDPSLARLDTGDETRALKVHLVQNLKNESGAIIEPPKLGELMRIKIPGAPVELAGSERIGKQYYGQISAFDSISGQGYIDIFGPDVLLSAQHQFELRRWGDELRDGLTLSPAIATEFRAMIGRNAQFSLAPVTPGLVLRNRKNGRDKVKWILSGGIELSGNFARPIVNPAITTTLGIDLN